jgi:hypothetical protein
MVGVVTRSAWLGVLLAGLYLATYPKFNSYPKTYPFVVAMWLFWRYYRQPSITNGVFVGVAVLVAFFSRHDVGVYVAIGAGALMLACHWREWRLPRPVLAAGITIVIGLAPFLVFLQLNGGVAEYFRQAGAFITGTRELESQFTRPTFSIDTSQPPVVVRPLEANTESGSSTLRRMVPLLRLSVLPGVITPSNIVAFAYWLFVAVPVIALGLLAYRWRRGLTTPDAAWVFSLAVMCAVSQQGLLRPPLTDRLADAGATTAVLAGWLLSRWLGADQSPLPASVGRSRHWRVVLAGALLGVAGLGLVSVTSFARLVSPDGLAGLAQRGPLGVVRQVQETAGYLGTSPPLDAWDVPENPGLPAIARWINTCTQPEDRVFATWWASELYFYADRPFGAGHVFLLPGFWLDEKDQYAMVHRMEQQSLPVVVSEMNHYRNIAPGQLRLREYLDATYRVVREEGFGSTRSLYRIWIHKDAVPVGVYERLGLPCFR